MSALSKALAAVGISLTLAGAAALAGDVVFCLAAWSKIRDTILAFEPLLRISPSTEWTHAFAFVAATLCAFAFHYLVYFFFLPGRGFFVRGFLGAEIALLALMVPLFSSNNPAHFVGKWICRGDGGYFAVRGRQVNASCVEVTEELQWSARAISVGKSPTRIDDHSLLVDFIDHRHVIFTPLEHPKSAFYIGAGADEFGDILVPVKPNVLREAYFAAKTAAHAEEEKRAQEVREEIERARSAVLAKIREQVRNQAANASPSANVQNACGCS